jgi:uncharacterized protein YdhG (YjbR/CyaY superfamily)
VAATVEEYLAGLPADVRARVEELCGVVRKVVPDAGEAISYAMPVFTLDGAPLLHVGAWRHHIGLYPVPRLDPELEVEVAPLRSGQATVTLRPAARLPHALLVRLVQAVADRRG